MGFFSVESKSEVDPRGVSVEFLREHQCKVCPLNKERGLLHPRMEPYGPPTATYYILGEAPGKEEDRRGRPFVGPAGRVLHFRIPEKYAADIRYNNCVRTRPPNNETPDYIALECCRPSVVRDIERTKPKAIFGLGAVPLNWAIGQTGITKWNGRRVPVKVGSHSCWYYPIVHPSYVMRSRKFVPRTTKEFGSDEEFTFAMDLKRAFAEVPTLPDPVIHSEGDAVHGVRWLDGSRGRRDVDQVKAFLKAAARDKVVGFDYETNRLRPYSARAKILSVGISGLDCGTLAFPIWHKESGWTKSERKDVIRALEDFLYEAPCIRAAHNLAFELEWTGYFFGEDALRAQQWEDTMSQGFILDERQGVLSLGALTLQYFGLDIKKITHVDTTKLNDTPIDTVLKYNGIDAKYHLLLYLVQKRRLTNEGLQGLYREHLRRVPTMVLSQIAGVPIDRKETQDLVDRFDSKLEDVEDRLSNLPVVKLFRRKKGKPFSPSSNQDVMVVLRSLGKSPDKTDKDVLKGVDHEFAQLMLEYRESAKLVSTYLDPVFDKSVIFPDGLMHPVFSVNKTRTWRTSSEFPNVQNWPKREHKEIRRQVKPGPGKKVVSFDYAGIQARNVAMESLDKNLVDAFWDRYDIHRDWMERIVELYPKWVKEGTKSLAADGDLLKKYRHYAKNKLVFPLFFGSQATSCARNLEIPDNIALEISEEFWDRFAQIRSWQERTKDNYLRSGYVTGLSGFRRRMPVSQNEIINTPIQSDEAAIVCDAMNRLSELEDPRFQACLEIHDDLTFIWDAKEVDRNAEIVIGMMLDVPFTWAHVVPIGVEMSVGDNWADQEGAGEFYSDEWNGGVNVPKELP